MAQQRAIEESALDNFLILLMKEPLDEAKLPNTLRLLIKTRTYLTVPDCNGNVDKFWQDLKRALGHPNERPPLSTQCSETDYDLQALLDSIVVPENTPLIESAGQNMLE